MHSHTTSSVGIYMEHALESLHSLKLVVQASGVALWKVGCMGLSRRGEVLGSHLLPALLLSRGCGGSFTLCGVACYHSAQESLCLDSG